MASMSFGLMVRGGTKGLYCEMKWIVDSAATRPMTPNLVSMTNYHECEGVARVAHGVAVPIKGIGDIIIRIQSDFGEMNLQLLNVAFVPLLCYKFSYH